MKKFHWLESWAALYLFFLYFLTFLLFTFSFFSYYSFVFVCGREARSSFLLLNLLVAHWSLIFLPFAYILSTRHPLCGIHFLGSRSNFVKLWSLFSNQHYHIIYPSVTPFLSFLTFWSASDATSIATSPLILVHLSKYQLNWSTIFQQRSPRSRLEGGCRKEISQDHRHKQSWLSVQVHKVGRTDWPIREDWRI